MSTSNLIFGLLILAAGVLLAAAMWPGDPAAPPEQMETFTIVGCLQAGEAQGTLVLGADDKQTYHVHAADDLAIVSHLNHRVELTGTVGKIDTDLTLKVSTLKMVANSCTQPSHQGVSRGGGNVIGPTASANDSRVGERFTMRAHVSEMTTHSIAIAPA